MPENGQAVDSRKTSVTASRQNRVKLQNTRIKTTQAGMQMKLTDITHSPLHGRILKLKVATLQYILHPH